MFCLAVYQMYFDSKVSNPKSTVPDALPQILLKQLTTFLDPRAEEKALGKETGKGRK